MTPVTLRIRFQLLGSVEATVDGRAVALTGRQRALLAILALSANHVVSVDRIADWLWGENLPVSAIPRVRALVAEVRRALGSGGPERVITRNPGYLLSSGPGELDIDEFESLVAEARRAARAGRHQEAIALYDKAVTLWRGDPFPDLTGPAAETERHRFEEIRTGAVEGRVDANLALGLDHAAVADLTRLIREQPLRETPRGLLMLALYRSGRLPEALGVYREFRTRLVRDVGVEPTAELRRLHQRLLAGDPPTQETGARTTVDHTSGVPPAEGVTSAPAPVPGAASRRNVPHQLPASGRFVGRAAQLRRLDAFRIDAERVVLVVGPAGVGKTSLATHWAHGAAEFFPDGQLFLDMRGFDTSEPMALSEALPLLLQGLGQGARDIPVPVDAQIALYRSLLASRRILLVLDDVADPTQVRKLLPPNPESLAVITSRDRLGSLVALDGARRLTLDVLEKEDALGLIAHGIGDDRLRGEPEAAAQLVELCDRLPLALCVAMSWLADHEHRRIGQYVSELADQGRLVKLRVEGDESAAVGAALDLSYAALRAPARRVFRFLGLVPSVSVSAAVGAALTGAEVAETEDLLRVVARVHLVEEMRGNRFLCHDLVREYAAERGRAEDTGGEREAAVQRLMDYYLACVVNAAKVYGLQPPNLPHEPTRRLNVSPADFRDPAEAGAWFEEEWGNIAIAVSHAAEHGPRRYCWLLVEAMQDLLHHSRTYAEWLRVAGIALAAAVREGDLLGQAAMHHSLGLARWRMADLGTAFTESERGLALARRAGWRRGEAMALQLSGVVLKQLGEPHRALPYYRKAIVINGELGYRRGEAGGLNNMASAYLRLARLDRAEECLLASRPLADESGDRNLQALTLVNLGLVWQQQARFPDAVLVLDEALAVSHAAHLQYAAAVTYETFGWVHSDAGHYAQAKDAFDTALRLAQQVENRNCQIASLTGMAGIELKNGRMDSALEQLNSAREIAEHTGTELVGVLWTSANALLRLGRYDEAYGETRRALALAADGSRLDLPRLYNLLAAVQLEAGDGEQCFETCEKALKFARRSGQRLERARILITLGRAHHQTGNERAARNTWRRAHGVFTALDTPEQDRTAALLS
ncbi:BTAD domain-containing putative transcriptional regulator [Streptomyces sp. NPDC059569]|uniref:AfsR/SARP family transcriptional regulator n=1 Tax=Streptomyces sp. NPDC059569 TaxID=3346869 RepID=UPI0036B9AEED